MCIREIIAAGPGRHRGPPRAQERPRLAPSGSGQDGQDSSGRRRRRRARKLEVPSKQGNFFLPNLSFLSQGLRPLPPGRPPPGLHLRLPGGLRRRGRRGRQGGEGEGPPTRPRREQRRLWRRLGDTSQPPRRRRKGAKWSRITPKKARFFSFYVDVPHSYSEILKVFAEIYLVLPKCYTAVNKERGMPSAKHLHYQ